MKKFVSSILVLLMLTAMLPAAVWADTTETANPERITAGGETVLDVACKKADTKNITVTTTTAKAAAAFGDVETMFDGDKTTTTVSKRFAWKADTANFTVTFASDVTFDTVQFWEFKQTIKKYTVTVKSSDGNEVFSLKDKELSANSDNTEKIYERTIKMGQNVTGRTVEFNFTCDKDIAGSILEMEFLKSAPTVTGENISTHTSFGGLDAIFDGIGMVGGVDGDNKTISENGEVTAYTINPYRWVNSNTSNPILTIELKQDLTFSEIVWTECRKMITAATVECYLDGEKKKSVTQNFTDKKTTNNFFKRTISLGENVTADKVVLNLTCDTDAVMSIAEMQFVSKPDAPSIKDNNGNEVSALTTNYTIDKAFDGVWKSGDTSVPYDSFMFTPYTGTDGANIYEVPITIQFDLGEEKTFNYAELAEQRCALGNIDVMVSNDKVKWEKAGTMPKLTYFGGTGQETIHSISFDSVTARYVRYVINEMADLATLQKDELAKAVTISEISLYNFPSVEISKIYPVTARGNEVTADGLNNFNNAHSNITIKNTSSEEKSYLLIGAAFTEDGVLKMVSVDEVSVEEGKERTFTRNVNTEGNKKISRVSIFAWTEDNMSVAEAVALDKNAEN